jgi:hypothetical protein
MQTTTATQATKDKQALDIAFRICNNGDSDGQIEELIPFMCFQNEEQVEFPSFESVTFPRLPITIVVGQEIQWSGIGRVTLTSFMNACNRTYWDQNPKTTLNLRMQVKYRDLTKNSRHASFYWKYDFKTLALVRMRDSEFDYQD